MAALSEIPVAPVAPDRFADVLGEGFREMEPQIARARELLRGRVVWHVNSTARGGGVAEMLRSHLAYAQDQIVEARADSWLTIRRIWQRSPRRSIARSSIPTLLRASVTRRVNG